MKWLFTGRVPSSAENRVAITFGSLFSGDAPASDERAEFTVPGDAEPGKYVLEVKPTFGSFRRETRTIVVA